MSIGPDTQGFIWTNWQGPQSHNILLRESKQVII